MVEQSDENGHIFDGSCESCGTGFWADVGVGPTTCTHCGESLIKPVPKPGVLNMKSLYKQLLSQVVFSMTDNANDMQNDDVPFSLVHYQQYLEALAEYCDTSENEGTFFRTGWSLIARKHPVNVVAYVANQIEYYMDEGWSDEATIEKLPEIAKATQAIKKDEHGCTDALCSECDEETKHETNVVEALIEFLTEEDHINDKTVDYTLLRRGVSAIIRESVE